jgi:DNA-directed RNA polymerase subunit K/omega
MDPLRKREFLKHVRNEYLGAVLAAKVARRLHAISASEGEDPTVKVTSRAISLITDGKVEFEAIESSEDAEAPETKVDKAAESDEKVEKVEKAKKAKK